METTQNLTKILIHEESTRRTFQGVFLSNVAERLTLLLQEFNALDLDAEFSVSDIDSILSQNAQTFIRSKVVPTIKEATIGGLKVSPDKVFAMSDLNLREFEAAYNGVVDYIQDTRKYVSERQHLNLRIDFSHEFFSIADEVVTVNQAAFENWVEEFCRDYAETPAKLKAYHLMDTIAKSLNELRQLKPKGEYAGHNQTFNKITSSYPAIVLSSIGRLIEFNESKQEFQVKHDGYIRSF